MRYASKNDILLLDTHGKRKQLYHVLLLCFSMRALLKSYVVSFKAKRILSQGLIAENSAKRQRATTSKWSANNKK